MEQERNLKEKMMLSFRGIVEALFKGKGIIMMGERFRNTEIARLLHVKPASFRLRRWRLKKKLEGLGSDLRSIIMKL